MIGSLALFTLTIVPAFLGLPVTDSLPNNTDSAVSPQPFSIVTTSPVGPHVNSRITNESMGLNKENKVHSSGKSLNETANNTHGDETKSVFHEPCTNGSCLTSSGDDLDLATPSKGDDIMSQTNATHNDSRIDVKFHYKPERVKVMSDDAQVLGGFVNRSEGFENAMENTKNDSLQMDIHNSKIPVTNHSSTDGNGNGDTTALLGRLNRNTTSIFDVIWRKEGDNRTDIMTTASSSDTENLFSSWLDEPHSKSLTKNPGRKGSLEKHPSVRKPKTYVHQLATYMHHHSWLTKQHHLAHDGLVPLDDGPFGSLIWKDKKYLISVLIPIGVGIAGAVIFVVAAYATRICRGIKKPFIPSANTEIFLQHPRSRSDDIFMLVDTTDDEM